MATTESSTSHRAIYIIFISLIIDLLAFTLILPLLPSLLDYYRTHDKEGLYSYLHTQIHGYQQLVGAPDQFTAVLFGGLIGSLFSLLQFLASPIIGALSDVYGRRPIILLTMVGEVISYTIWSQAVSFQLFVLARVVGGVSKGNISLSTAIITDVTTGKTRGKGMALIGMAFSVGFILGPLLGATLSRWRPEEAFYVVPATLALILSVTDMVYLYLYLPETLPQQKRAKSLGLGLQSAKNFIFPVNLFSFQAVKCSNKEDQRRLSRLGLIYFLYLFLYSGLEFTLTFLTHLRFQYTSMQQGKMFVYIGMLMAFVQGGFVRRISPGKERRVAELGLVVIIPSFIIIGLAESMLTLYVGLTLYAFASATVVSCLTTIASSFGGDNQKGTVTGIFRSLGALARALGPLVASTAFWSIGATLSYFIGGVCMTAPLLLLRRVQLRAQHSD